MSAKITVGKPETIYETFTDPVDEIVEQFVTLGGEREGGWSGHVVTTLSAGWPSNFLEAGAQRCIVIEVNPKQISHVYPDGPDPEQVELVQSDIFEIPEIFWANKLHGDEVVFLSNIPDAHMLIGEWEPVIDLLVRMMNAPEKIKRMDFIITSSFSSIPRALLDKAELLQYVVLGLSDGTYLLELRESESTEDVVCPYIGRITIKRRDT
jgi:hypothetical protein